MSNQCDVDFLRRQVDHLTGEVDRMREELRGTHAINKEMACSLIRMQQQIYDLPHAAPPSRITRLRRRLASIILGGPVPS